MSCRRWCWPSPSIRLVEGSDLSSLEFVLSGAAPLGADLAAACAGRIGVQTIQGYGMTEMSPVSHFSRRGATGPAPRASLVPNTECRIVDPETGADCPAGTEGELWVRGPQVMVGLPRPSRGDGGDADARRLAAHRRSRPHRRRRLPVHRRPGEGTDQGQGLSGCAGRTGGAARRPSRGRRRGGGRNSGRRGGRGAEGLCRAGGGEAPDLAELQAFLDGHVAHYKQIHGLALVEAIPKSPSGKILRRVLRAQG
jgi:acyl-CoA synthetase (AMP-forming)/AMP-acid ligase II